VVVREYISRCARVRPSLERRSENPGPEQMLGDTRTGTRQAASGPAPRRHTSARIEASRDSSCVERAHAGIVGSAGAPDLLQQNFRQSVTLIVARNGSWGKPCENSFAVH